MSKIRVLVIINAILTMILAVLNLLQPSALGWRWMTFSIFLMMILNIIEYLRRQGKKSKILLVILLLAAITSLLAFVQSFHLSDRF